MYITCFTEASTQENSNVPPQVQGVTISRGVSNGSPSLIVSWTAVSGSGITYSYTVRYSTSSGTTTEPPSGASTVKGITGTSTKLSELEQGTMYYIWVAAVSSDGAGPYSTRVSESTFEGIFVFFALSIMQLYTYINKCFLINYVCIYVSVLHG